jgi:predicted RNA-binding protein YlxR (DUF448 family)
LAAVQRAYTPLRTCLGCGERDEQSRLIRLTVCGEGMLKIDRDGEGRGGYLHRAAPCWQNFIRRKHHYRAFRMELRKDAKEKLTQELKARNRE